MSITKAHIEDTALTWFEALDYETVHGPDIAPGEPAEERETLLPRLMNGELLVGEAKERVEGE